MPELLSELSAPALVAPAHNRGRPRVRTTRRRVPRRAQDCAEQRPCAAAACARPNLAAPGPAASLARPAQ
eukprot:5852825-Alexandrium_andersonii.AAC.1